MERSRLGRSCLRVTGFGQLFGSFPKRTLMESGPGLERLTSWSREVTAQNALEAATSSELLSIMGLIGSMWPGKRLTVTTSTPPLSLTSTTFTSSNGPRTKLSQESMARTSLITNLRHSNSTKESSPEISRTLGQMRLTLTPRSTRNST